MSPTQIINFHHLTSQLTVAETKEFFSRLIDDYPTKTATLLFKALATHFKRESGEVDTNVSGVTQIASDIIQSRDLTNQSINEEPIKLDTLPRRLIGVTASFLPQREYASFSRCTRSIYLASNSPHLLQKVVVMIKRDGSARIPAEFTRFRMVNLISLVHLSLATDDLIHSRINGISQMQRIPPLKIFVDPNRSTVDALRLITTNQDIAEKVKYLSMEFTNGAIDIGAFTLLMAFPNVQYLDANAQTDRSHVKDDRSLLQTAVSTFRNLKALKIGKKDRVIGESLLQSVSSNLQFLSWDTGISEDAAQLHFGELTQLRIRRDGMKFAETILTKAPKLEMVILPGPPGAGLSSAVSKCLLSCSALKYLEIWGPGQISSCFVKTICTSLETMERENWKGSSLKLKFWGSYEFGIMDQQRLVKALMDSNFEHFMLIDEQMEMEPILYDGRRVWTDKDFLGRDICIITNRQCTIDGFGENWIMS